MVYWLNGCIIPHPSLVIMYVTYYGVEIYKDFATTGDVVVVRL